VSATTNIQYERHEAVALITFHRPDKLNAFSQAMLGELLAALDRAANDSAVRAVLLTGAGRAFSAGADLAELEGLLTTEVSVRTARAALAPFSALTRRLLALPKPVIAAVNGVAVGLGAEIAIASDIRIAADSASFAFAEVRRGLFETNGVTYLLPRLVGLGNAAHLMLSGNTIDAAEAWRLGLVTQVVPSAELHEVALTLAQQIAANAPLSLRLVKGALQRTYDLDLEAMLALEEDGMLACLASEDLQEGLRAFAEKRPPRYKGQ
jgi:enoyl-CoA hydratase/carnithine racemase